MKKLGLTVFTVICAICMAFGVMVMTNVMKASADPVVVDGQVPVLSATRYKLSTDKGGMLIATGIKNYADVYEVGYTGIDGATKVNASTTKYYTSIKSGANEWTAQDLFGNEFEGAGLIVWEIEYDRAEEYTYTAYAKYGKRVDGALVEYDPVRSTSGTAKTTDVEQFTITFEMGDGTAIDPISRNYGTPVSALNSVSVTPPTGYHFVKWQIGRAHV